ncbi:T9SS type A sorting domain-containing protein [Bacteroidota bacterium]
MKQIFTFACMIFFGITVAQSQVLIAQWTFPTGTDADSIANEGIPANLNKAIYTDGGTSAIDFSKNGFTNKAAQCTGWNDGMELKCWVVGITTTDYEELTISSKQQSGGNNPGPRDWEIQYRIGTGGVWTDIPDGAFEVQNDWTTGVLDSIELPTECRNQASLYLRWIMTSNTNSAGNPVESSGINKIDDIVITGKLINTAIPEEGANFRLSVYPNPCTNQVTVSSSENLSLLIITDMNGREVYRASGQNKTIHVQTDKLPAGLYLIRATTISSKVNTSRFFKVN